MCRPMARENGVPVNCFTALSDLMGKATTAANKGKLPPLSDNVQKDVGSVTVLKMTTNYPLATIHKKGSDILKVLGVRFGAENANLTGSYGEAEINFSHVKTSELMMGSAQLMACVHLQTEPSNPTAGDGSTKTYCIEVASLTAAPKKMKAAAPKASPACPPK